MGQTRAIEWGEHLPRMYRVALRIVGRPDAAEDVVQEACAKVLRTLRSFEGRSRLETWLHRITVNCAIDRLRHERRGPISPDGANGALDGMIKCTRQAPDAGAEQRDLCRIAIASIEALPDDCRTVFVLTQVDGYTYDEASAIENLPRGTVASRVARAKRILLDHLTPARWDDER